MTIIIEQPVKNNDPNENVDAARALLYYAVPLAVVGLIYWPSLTTMAQIWDTDPTYSHGFLVPLLAIAFAVISWRRSGRRPLVNAQISRDELTGGFLAIGCGLILHAICMVLTNLVLDTLSMIMIIRGVLDVLGGREVKRTLSFATLFLIFMAPLPASWYLPLAQSMQALAAIVSENIFAMAGVPVFREGYIVRLPDFTMEVGAACSGLRSLMSVIALAAAISFFGADRSRWYRWTIVIVSPLISVASNCIRVLLTGVIAITVDPKFAQGVYHDAGGIVMIGLSALLILGLASLLARIDRRWQKEKEMSDKTVSDAPVSNSASTTNSKESGV